MVRSRPGQVDQERHHGQGRQSEQGSDAEGDIEPVHRGGRSAGARPQLWVAGCRSRTVTRTANPRAAPDLLDHIDQARGRPGVAGSTPASDAVVSETSEVPEPRPNSTRHTSIWP